MSEKKCRSYKKVFSETEEILGGELKVKEITTDSEKSIWPAIPDVLPDVFLRE